MFSLYIQVNCVLHLRYSFSSEHLRLVCFYFWNDTKVISALKLLVFRKIVSSEWRFGQAMHRCACKRVRNLRWPSHQEQRDCGHVWFMCEVCTKMQSLKEEYGEGPLVLGARVVEWWESPYLLHLILVWCYMGVEYVLFLTLLWEFFSIHGYSNFSPSLKMNTSKFQFNWIGVLFEYQVKLIWFPL